MFPRGIIFVQNFFFCENLSSVWRVEVETQSACLFEKALILSRMGGKVGYRVQGTTCSVGRNRNRSSWCWSIAVRRVFCSVFGLNVFLIFLLPPWTMQ